MGNYLKKMWKNSKNYCRNISRRYFYEYIHDSFGNGKTICKELEYENGKYKWLCTIVRAYKLVCRFLDGYIEDGEHMSTTLRCRPAGTGIFRLYSDGDITLEKAADKAGMSE